MNATTIKQRLLPWITCATLLAFTASSKPAGARIVNRMSYEEMAARADLVVIARAVSNKDTRERMTLLGVPVVGVDTTFSAAAVLKAKDQRQPDVQRPGQTFILHHYREADPAQPESDGPDLVQFDPNANTQYLMFLTRRDEGRFEPLTGQGDAGFSLEQLRLPADPHPAAEQATADDAGQTSSAQSSATSTGPNGSISISSSSNHGGNVTSIVGPVKRVDAAAGILVLSGVEAVVGKDANGNVQVTSVKKDVTFLIAPGTVFTHLEGLQDIHLGDTVGATGEKQADGSVRATEVKK